MKGLLCFGSVEFSAAQKFVFFFYISTKNRIVFHFQGPGLFIIVPCVDAYTKVDLRTVTFDVPPQEVRLHEWSLLLFVSNQILFSFEKSQDSNKRFSHSCRRRSCLFSCFRSGHINNQCWGRTEKYTITCSDQSSKCVRFLDCFSFIWINNPSFVCWSIDIYSDWVRSLYKKSFLIANQ